MGYALALLLLTLALASNAQNVSFTFNNFFSTENLLLLGDTLVGADDGSLCMTYNRSGATGPYFISRVLHSSPLLMYSLTQGLAASFSTSFTFSIATNQTASSGDGFTFVFTPDNLLPHTQSATAGALGLFDVDLYKGFNASLLHIVAIEYDTFVNIEFSDPDDHHVGLDINGLTSTVVQSLPPELVLKSTNVSRRLTTWIDYDAAQSQLDVYLAVAPAEKVSATKVLSYSNLKIWDYLNSSSFVGFTAGTGVLQEKNVIYDWKFSSQLVSVPIPAPSPQPSPTSSNTKRNLLIAGLTVAVAIVLFVILFIGWKRSRMSIGLRLDVDLMTAPKRFSNRELRLATGDFKEVLGHGGSGEVYRGMITMKNGGVEHVAVKRIIKHKKQGEKEFKSEVMTIGKLRHRNLVHLLGWCSERGKLALVYQFMPNGSLEKLLYTSSGAHALSWPLRYSIIKGVAAALVYLHVDWEKLIIHRDIKASNVLLDGDLNARLGDFGLARFFDHDQYCTQASATGIAGTFGYIAPEYAMSGRVTRESDIFSFGILALEVACGRRPFSDTDETLLDFVWRKHEEGALMDVADQQMQGDFDVDEMRRMLHVGLLCSHPDPKARLPTRQVLQILRGETKVPELPISRPMAIYVQVQTQKVYKDGILASQPATSTIEGIQLSGPR